MMTDPWRPNEAHTSHVSVSSSPEARRCNRDAAKLVFTRHQLLRLQRLFERVKVVSG